MQKAANPLVAVVVALAATLFTPVASAQTQDDIEARDRLVANQENLLNTYRCLFGVDTEAVPGGCPKPTVVTPGPVPTNPTQNDLVLRDRLIQSQETLLNVYRCMFDIDTHIVPGGCGFPEHLVWPRFEPAAWPRTPDEAAAGFAQHVPRGERAAKPRPAVQTGMTATAELPRLDPDGLPFGVATTIHMQQVQVADGSLAWVVIGAHSNDIVVKSPMAGELLANGIVVEGEGKAFEGTIVFEIRDQDGLLGRALAQGGALGENLPFEISLSFERPASGHWATLTGFTISPIDGGPLSSLTMLPLRLVGES